MTTLGDPVSRDGVLDGAAWGEQPLIWAERVRGRALWWPRDEDWFANDPLGRMPHTHPDASELYMVASGRLGLTVGRERVEVEPGGYVLIPPDTFHDPVNAGDDDLCLFVLVAPNWRDRRWKPEGFTAADYEGVPELGDTGRDGALPGDARLRAEVVTIGAGEPRAAERIERADRVVYCLSGSLHVEAGRLAGTLAPHEYVHLPAGLPHRLTAAAGPCRLLSALACDA